MTRVNKTVVESTHIEHCHIYKSLSNRTRNHFLLLSNVQIYNLLPVKVENAAPFGFPRIDNGENCIHAQEITIDGIVYTPNRAIDGEYVHSVFKVIPPESHQS